MASDKKVYNLLQLNKSIKNALETKAGESGIWVKAEISSINRKSGNTYIGFVDQKDGKKRASIGGVIWSRDLPKINQSLGDEADNILKVGAEIVFLCKVTFHVIYGLRLSITEIDLSYMLGELEKRKKEIIDQVHKQGIDKLNKAKPLPTVPHKIALVGSPGTSGFRDFTHHVIKNEWRFRFEIEVFPTPVQGIDAATHIIKALKLADSSNPDVIVIVRGGGSPLDLDCFNDFELVQIIGNCSTPVITGIGHETDYCVADIVSHRFFKTPTDVGDFIVDISYNFSSLLVEIATKIGSRSQLAILNEKNYLERAKLNIREFSLKLLTEKRSSISQLKIDLKRDLELIIDKQKEAFTNIQNTLKILNPKNTLKRGYSIVRKSGSSIPCVDLINIGDEIDIEMQDGGLKATINEINSKDGK